MLPDQLARASVKRLHDVAGIDQVNDAVVSKWSRLALASFVHRPHPRELQSPDIGGDFGQRAVAPRLVVPTDHQPVARRRISQHRIGDWNEVRHFS